MIWMAIPVDVDEVYRHGMWWVGRLAGFDAYDEVPCPSGTEVTSTSELFGASVRQSSSKLQHHQPGQ
jgi:hypothetical protein